jgi:hypothetical protein
MDHIIADQIVTIEIELLSICDREGGGKYGCLGLLELIAPPQPREELFIGIDSFADARQFELLTKQIDSDPRIGKLFEEMKVQPEMLIQVLLTGSSVILRPCQAAKMN